MSQADEAETRRAATVIYVTDLSPAVSDPADLFDLACLARSDRHELLAVCLPDSTDGEAQAQSVLTAAAGQVTLPEFRYGVAGLRSVLRAAPVGVNLVVVAGYKVVARLLQEEKALFREKAVRLFLVGGYVNSDAPEGAKERLPTDPRLRERNPERFTPSGDPRVPLGSESAAAWATLLNSGEGVIWLPRDICLWRYAAQGLLEDGGALCELLRQVLAARHPEAPDSPALLSAMPALLLCLQPDPFAWMRLFRVIPARAEANADGTLSTFVTRTEAPNLYAVIAIDGQALGKRLTDTLREGTGV